MNKIATKVLSWANFVSIVVSILFAASLFFDRVGNQKAHHKNKTSSPTGK